MKTNAGVTRIGIVSALTLFRKALYVLLLTLGVGNIGLVVDADDMSDALEQVVSHKPAILLLDCEHCYFSFASIQKIRVLSPSTKCLLLGNNWDQNFAIQAARSGAWGVVSKKSDPAVMHKAVQALMGGEMWFGHGVITSALCREIEDGGPESPPLKRLTPRESEILVLLAKSYRNKEIAARLFLSQNTVRRYLETIYQKLEVHSRVEAVTLYLGQISPATQRFGAVTVTETLPAASLMIHSPAEYSDA